MGQGRGTAGADRIGERRIQMQALTAAGEWEQRQSDVVNEVSHRVGDLPQLRHGHALARVEVEHQSIGEAGLSVGTETPLRHMDLQRRLLRDPGQGRRAVDDRVVGGPGSVYQCASGEPVRRVLGQVLFEERWFLDAVGPALAGGRPAGDVRQHHLGDGRVVTEDVSLGRGPDAFGGRVEHLVRVGQPDKRSRRRFRRPHFNHHANVLPADTLGQ